MIEPGVRVLSVPGQNQRPQTFETVERIVARPEWNQLRPLTSIPQDFTPDASELWIDAGQASLAPGDALLFVSHDRHFLAALSNRVLELTDALIARLDTLPVEVTSSDIGDAPMLPELLAQIPADQDIASVTADGAYDTRKCHDAIAERGANAVIPPRKNAKPWKAITAGAVARNEALRASKYLGRALWRRWSGYHRRSRVETKMHCVKLLGQRLKARDFDRQVAEFQVRVAVLNGFTALGTPITDGHRVSLSGERGGPPLNRFVQQSCSPPLGRVDLPLTNRSRKRA